MITTVRLTEAEIKALNHHQQKIHTVFRGQVNKYDFMMRKEDEYYTNPLSAYLHVIQTAHGKAAIFPCTRTNCTGCFYKHQPVQHWFFPTVSMLDKNFVTWIVAQGGQAQTLFQSFEYAIQMDRIDNGLSPVFHVIGKNLALCVPEMWEKLPDAHEHLPTCVELLKRDYLAINNILIHGTLVAQSMQTGDGLW